MTDKETGLLANQAEMMPVAPIVNESDLELALKVAERNERLARKIKLLAIKQTNPIDWVDQGGKPYLQASGAEKIARLFGISWRICEGYPKREIQTDENGTYYIYTCQGEFEMGGKTIEVLGTCSQRDKFFGYKGGELKAESEIDVCNIMRKSVTNMEVNGITRMLGIRNLTWEEVKEGGVEQKKTNSVSYKSNSKEAKEVEGFVEEGTTRNGESGGKKWTKYDITVGGIRLSTFDSKIGEIAVQAKKQELKVHCTYKNDGKGNKIESLEIINESDIEEVEEANYD